MRKLNYPKRLNNRHGKKLEIFIGIMTLQKKDQEPRCGPV